MKNILLITVVMMLPIQAHAQENHREDKEGRREAPAASHAPAIHEHSSTPTVQVQNPHPIATRTAHEAVQTHIGASAVAVQQQPHRTSHSTGPRMYARQPAARPTPQQPVARNNLFHHTHHDNWHPRYNFYDHRYHFYPYINVNPVVYLSAGYTQVNFNGDAYYYDNGMFYQDEGDPQGYIAVDPPIGVIINALPAGAMQTIVNGVVYYVYNGIYYVPVPNGYQVVEVPQ